MPRSKSVELHDRNLRIVQMVQEGYGLQVVADHFGVSRARVSQIVSEYQSPISDDNARDVLRTQFETLLTDHLIPIARGIDRQPLISTGKGTVITDPDTGEILYDKRVQLEAMDKARSMAEFLAKLNGWGRRPREKDESKEIAEAMAYLQELAAQKQALQARVTQYEAVVIPLDENGSDGEPGSNRQDGDDD